MGRKDTWPDEISSGDDWLRRAFPAIVIFGAPTVAAAMTVGIVAATEHFTPSIRWLGDFIPTLNALLSGAGAALGALLIRRPLAGRIAYAFGCLFLGFMWHWLVVTVLSAVTGLTHL